MKRARVERWHWIIGIVVVAFLVIGTLLQRPNNESGAPAAHFSDASPTGSKGFALLLQQMGYSTRVQDAPLDKIPADVRAWLIFNPKASFSTKESKDLLAWVEKGGTLIFCSPSTYTFNFSSLGGMQQFAGGIANLRTELGLQQNFSYTQPPSQTGFYPDLVPLRFDPTAPEREGVSTASAVPGQLSTSKPTLAISGTSGASTLSGTSIFRYNRGRGCVYVLPDAWLFTNYGLSKPANSILATNFVRLHAKSGAVVWDERQHGDDLRPPEPDSIIARLRKPPFSYALWQALIAGVLIWAFVGRRLGTAVPLPERGTVTRASQFALAMGGLFQKIGRPSAAAQIVGDNFRRRLASRLGLSPADPDPVLARRAQEMGGIPYDVVDRLLLQSRTPAQNDTQALRDAQEMEAVLRQLEAR